MSSPVVCMCLRFASSWRLWKSWAWASSQPGGQTRKQMDLFGLNPSHATSSSWPSSSNMRASLQGRRKGTEWECMCVLGLGAWEVHVMLLEPSRESRKTDGNERERERLCLCRPFLTDTVCAKLCWHMAPASMLKLLVCRLPLPSLFSSFPPLFTLHSALSAKPALCLFVPGMFCLFWNIEPPHPLWSTAACFSHSASLFLAPAVFQW